MTWEDQAVCKGKPPEWWFPPEAGGMSGGPRQRGMGTTGRLVPELWTTTLARAICGKCPVREECLDTYLDEPYGIFGGLNGAERRSLKRRRRESARSA